eukprot:PhM_4_TR12734/c0_g1_i1/m.59863/K04798/pfdB, PFDN6; prefoldin beta subunit
MSLELLNKQVQEEAENVRVIREKRSKLVTQRHTLTSQVTENDMVKAELANLDTDATIYKLIGPVLVSQDKSDANAVVEKRLEYLNNEMKRVDATIKDYDKKEEELIGKVQSMQRQAHEMAKKQQEANQ